MQNNIASVAYHVYDPTTEQAQGLHSAALEVENSLRNQGYIASYDSNRRGIWLFDVTSKDPPSDVIGRHPATLEVCGHTLVLGEEGVFDPTSLQRSRGPANSAQNIPTSSPSNATAHDPSARGALVSPSQGSGPSFTDGDARLAPPSNNDTKPGSPAQKIIYEHFITAILSTISVAFCNQAKAIPLNYRTVLIPPSQSRDDGQDPAFTNKDPILGTFRTYLTTTGSLVISLYFSLCNSLTSLEDVITANLTPSNRLILAAPFGVLATKQELSNGEVSASDAIFAQTPNTQALSFRGIPSSQESAWKQTCLKALELLGLNTSAFRTRAWVNLLISRRLAQDDENEAKRPQTTVPWPGSLCFRKRPIMVSTTSRMGETMLSGHEECHDPLGNARGWFSSSAERDEKLAKRRTERASVQKQPNNNDPTIQKPNGHSPLALRRPSVTTAGVMYPTPPDAIHQQLGVTPSFDGAVTSSPGHPPHTALVADVDTAMANTTQLNDTYPDGWDSNNEPKKAESDNNMLDNSDDVFGEMEGDDMFGDNDITEDDFNFFDARPGNVELDVSMGSVHESHLPPPLPPPPQLPPAPTIEAPPRQLPDEQLVAIPKPSADEAVFAKPELKHARSSMNDTSITRDRRERTGSAKRESSPFDPDTVFKRVRASLTPVFDEPNSPIRKRRNSIFEKVTFDPKLPMINKKYQQGGTYDCDTEYAVKRLNANSAMLSEAEYSKGHSILNKKLKELPLPAISLIKSFASIDGPASHTSPSKPDGGFISDIDDSDMESDRDDSSSTSEILPISPVKSTFKRSNLDDDAVSQATSSREVDMLDDVDEQLAIELPRLSKPEPPEMPLCKFFSDPEPLTLDSGLSDDDLIQIAQLVTEQAVTGFLQIGACQKKEEATPLTTMKGYELIIARKSLRILHKIIPTRLGGAIAVQLKGLLDIADIPSLAQPNRVPTRQVAGREQNAENFKPNSLYPIPGPHLEVRRSETKLSVMPSAVTFWESLGLSPSPGGKDIHALCVFPGWKGMADHVGTFLGRMKSVYESLKLGTFSNMKLSGDLTDGILPYEVDRISTSPDATITGHGSAIVESLEALRTSLSDWVAKEKNLVVFFVYSPANPGSIVEACVAFHRCFDIYRKILATRREKPQNELVVQLVPANLLSSPTALVVPPPAEFARLCMETYDRCTLFVSAEGGGPVPAPAIVLEQPLPRLIDFKLNISPSASPLHENSCIHVAYAQSIDDRWVTAAWTNNRGYQQATSSYCLARRGKTPATTMNDVAHEIWESTLELIAVWKVHWRIMITKSGPMDQQEMEFWIDLARTESKASVTLSLATVDTNPSLQLIPPAVKLPSMATSALYSTPVSTPQASIVSPEQYNTPATPMRDNALAATPGAETAAEPDGDAFLVDVTEQTWGAVSGHRLSNSPSMLEVRPALISGYLIKRTGTKAEEPPVVMEVNLIHAETNPRAYEPLFREMLSQFRGLGTLARARGMVDRASDVRPWHIAAAEKGVRAMYLLL